MGAADPTGLAWLDNTTQRWPRVPLRAVVTAKQELVGGEWEDTPLLSLTRRGVIVRDIDSGEGKYPTSFEGYQVVEPNDLVLCLFDIDETPRTVGRAKQRGMITAAYSRFAVDPILADVRFLEWLFVSIDDAKALRPLYTGLRKVVQKPRLMAMRIALPPIDEQRAIADYLDEHTARIDALIEKQESLIAMFAERLAVARNDLAGLIGTGDRLKFSFAEIDTRVGESWSEWPLMSVSAYSGVRRRSERTGDAPRADDLSIYKVCEPNDVVINRMSAYQGALGVAPERGYVSPDYAVLRTHEGVDPRWLATVMRSPRFVSEMTSRLRGIGGVGTANVRTPRVSVGEIGEIRVPAIDLATQRARLAAFNAVEVAIDSLIAKTREHIALAKERRSALITAAVTGQFDVRTARKVA